MAAKDRDERILDATLVLIEQEEHTGSFCSNLHGSDEYAEALLQAAASVMLGHVYADWDDGRVKRAAKAAEEFHRQTVRSADSLMDMLDEQLPTLAKMLRRRRYLKTQASEDVAETV